MSTYKTYTFPDVETLVISGDIHGEFGILISRVLNEYSLQNALVVVAGDCGFGFYRKGYYENIYQKYGKRLSKRNVYILFVRGNHDNPAYFDGLTIDYKRFKCIPDYSIVNAANHTLLCVGGGVSIDRTIRLTWKNKEVGHYYGEPQLMPAYYWPDELPVLKPEILEELKIDGVRPDTIVTHTAPSWCELSDKGPFFFKMMEADPELERDNEIERKTMDELHEWLCSHDMRPERWIYGHFHRSWHAVIDDVAYSLLDCNELKMIY